MMDKRYFGTDGIRGTTNQTPLVSPFVTRLGMAAARYFKRKDGRRSTVVIGKDTRLSGYMIETALVSGFISAGMDVAQFGPLPTPAVANLTTTLRADLGVVITASHNPYQDNGIKLFGPDGYKLDDAQEAEIEALMDEPYETGLVGAGELGRARRIDDAGTRYTEIVKATFPRRMSLKGLRIVVDCANGAAYKVAPAVLWELGADVIAIHDRPDGFNINADCGATAPESLAEEVRRYRADIGLALDGDADRLVVVDEAGRVIDGGQVLGLIAKTWKRQGRLSCDRLVTTVMSTIALDRAMAREGVEVVRTGVGDRNVVQAMREGGGNLGGESSGHVVMRDYATTGDALIAALQVLGLLIESDKPASELLSVFEPVPQIKENVRHARGATPLSNDQVKAAIGEAESALGEEGRLLVRASGTEPVIRILAEGPEDAARKAAKIVREAVEAQAA
ncbi:MAG: phosphoglucosamine mutase [Oceanicaulis sp.]